jgi:hypothetical protein
MNRDAFIFCQFLSSVWFEFFSVLRKIGNCIFSTGLPCIDIPASVEVLGESAFSHSAVCVVGFERDSVLREIGTQAFTLTQLTFIENPASVEVIGRCAFIRWGWLESVTFKIGSLWR